MLRDGGLKRVVNVLQAVREDVAKANQRRQTDAPEFQVADELFEIDGALRILRRVDLDLAVVTDGEVTLAPFFDFIELGGIGHRPGIADFMCGAQPRHRMIHDRHMISVFFSEHEDAFCGHRRRRRCHTCDARATEVNRSRSPRLARVPGEVRRKLIGPSRRGDIEATLDRRGGDTRVRQAIARLAGSNLAEEHGFARRRLDEITDDVPFVVEVVRLHDVPFHIDRHQVVVTGCRAAGAGGRVRIVRTHDDAILNGRREREAARRCTLLAQAFPLPEQELKYLERCATLRSRRARPQHDREADQSARLHATPLIHGESL